MKIASLFIRGVVACRRLIRKQPTLIPILCGIFNLADVRLDMGLCVLECSPVEVVHGDGV